MEKSLVWRISKWSVSRQWRALAFICCGAVPYADLALARIAVTHAEYAAGVLVVRGETSHPGQRVTIDGRYDERTNRAKQFRFRIRYLPADCTIRIQAGEEIKHADVTNCESPQQKSDASVNREPMSSFSDRRYLLHFR